MGALVDSANLGVYLNAKETPSSFVPGTSSRINTTDLNIFKDLLAATGSPKATHFAFYPLKSTTSGEFNFDLSAAEGTDGAINLDGKTLLAYVVDCRACTAADYLLTSASVTNPYYIDPQHIRAECFVLVWCQSVQVPVDVGGNQFNFKLTSGNDGDVWSAGFLFGDP